MIPITHDFEHNGITFRIMRRDREGTITMYVFLPDSNSNVGNITHKAGVQAISATRKDGEKRTIRTVRNGLSKKEIIAEYLKWIVDSEYKEPDITKPLKYKPGLWLSRFMK